MQRVVIYQAVRWAADREAVAAIAAATETDAESAAALLGSRAIVFLDNLETTTAAELADALGRRGVDTEVEPMDPGQDKLGWLQAEIPKWVKRGLLHPGSVGRIYRNYGLEPPQVAEATAATTRAPRDPGALIRVVLGLGAVLVGLGLILFVAANWQRIPAPAKVAGALALTLAALHAGHRLRSGSRPHPWLGATLLLISLFGIGGVVILIYQIYHVPADSYRLPLLWGALCVPVALLLRFRPALYLASVLWFWAYLLPIESHGQLARIYPFLLLGFLLPYALAVRDKVFTVTHLTLLMLALIATLATQELWLCSVWVAALILLRLKYRETVYDWLLLAGSFIWQIVFVSAFPKVPDLFFAPAIGYFFYRAARTRSSLLLLAHVLNTLVWLFILTVQVGLRFDLPDPEATDVTLWLLAAGLLCYGTGKRLREAADLRLASAFLVAGGAAAAGLMAFILSFRFYADQAAFFGSPVFLGATLGLGFAGLVLALPAVWRQDPGDDGRRGSLLLLGLVAASLALSALAAPALGLLTVLFNLILFAGALHILLRGHRRQSLALFNLGIALFVLLIVARYFDTFVEFLPRSAFFVLGGVFLIVWALLADRQRRRKAAAEREEEAVESS